MRIEKYRPGSEKLSEAQLGERDAYTPNVERYDL
jgi:hypothetical protein